MSIENVTEERLKVITDRLNGLEQSEHDNWLKDRGVSTAEADANPEKKRQSSVRHSRTWGLVTGYMMALSDMGIDPEELEITEEKHDA